jgi:histidinol phosphatase-like enzyme
MAFSAKKDFPEIDLARSIIAGNKPSDMLFGKYAGMYSVLYCIYPSRNPLSPPEY